MNNEQKEYLKMCEQEFRAFRRLAIIIIVIIVAIGILLVIKNKII